jgi:hypothetical protein
MVEGGRGHAPGPPDCHCRVTLLHHFVIPPSRGRILIPWIPKHPNSGRMKAALLPKFDHGAALRVPPSHDAKGWSLLLVWLGESGRRLRRPGAVEVDTPIGPCVAMPGDWIVLSNSGAYHVTATPRTFDA